MILNPCRAGIEEPDVSRSQEFFPAWEAVFRSQKVPATSWLLVAQPDHAVLAADLAERIESVDFPSLDPEILQAIAVHDEGWKLFDEQAIVRDGRPLSFLDFSPSDFLMAWRGSIERAEEAGPSAGLVVSGHFFRLAQVHLQTRGENPTVRAFLQEEAERHARLLKLQSRSETQISALVDVLQFCDLLSLYLCSGSQEAIEFPQKFNSRAIRLRREGELCRVEPQLFGDGVSLGVSARNFPDQRAEVLIPILVA